MFGIEDPEKKKSCNQILIILLVTVIVGVVAVTLIVTLPSNAMQNATKNEIQNMQSDNILSHRKTLTINKLPTYINFTNILTATSAGSLQSSDKLKVNDYVFITGEDSHNGNYRILNLGSMTDKWILEKVK